MGQRLPAAEQIVQTDSVSDLRKHPMSEAPLRWDMLD